MSLVIPEIEPPKPRRFIKQPDVQQKNKQLNELNEKIKTIEASITNLSSQIEFAVTPKADMESRQALTAELRKIIGSQDDIKKKRHLINDQIRVLDQSIKKKVSEISAKTSKYNFKTVDDIDRKIRKLESDIESGNLMLVEEKKSLKEISSLNKLKKDFAAVELIQKSIDSDKAKIVELKSSLSSHSNKEVQAQFESVTKQLDELSNKNKGVQSKRDELFGKRRELQNEKFELLKQIRKIRDDFDAKFKKFKADMDNERKKREEEEKAYRLYLERNELLEEIKEIESSAQSTASADKIEQIKAVILLLNPSYKFEDDVSPLAELNTSSLDSVKEKTEVKLPENAEIIKKEEETFFAPTAVSKKGKKNQKKKQNKGANSAIITQLTLLDVSIPESTDDHEKIIKELEEKLEESKKEQEEESKKAAEKAAEKVSQIKEQVSDLEKQILEELAKEKERTSKKAEEKEAPAAAEETPESA